MTQIITSEQYRLFARLLQYPQPGMASLVKQVLAGIRPAHPDAVTMLADFLRFVEQEPQSRLEELYTNTFDLQGVGNPYVGHYLFHESYQRSWFMARLNREYRLWSYTAGNELPDHMAVVLGFLALGNQDEFSQTLLEEGLKPALQKMTEDIKGSGNNPYYLVVQAIKLVVCETGNTSSRNSDDSKMSGVNHA